MTTVRAVPPFVPNRVEQPWLEEGREQRDHRERAEHEQQPIARPPYPCDTAHRFLKQP